MLEQDEEHVTVVGIDLTDNGRAVILRRDLDGAEVRFPCSAIVVRQAARLIGRTATATLAWRLWSRSADGVTDRSPVECERLRPWTERPFLDVVDEVRAAIEADGVEIDANEWLREMREEG